MMFRLNGPTKRGSVLNGVLFRPDEKKNSVAGLSDDDFAHLLPAARERACREEIEYGTFAEASDLYVTSPTCPSCDSEDVMRKGRTRTGARRYRCRACGDGLGALTGTALDGMRRDLSTLVSFVRLMRHDVPPDAVSKVVAVFEDHFTTDHFT